MQAQCTFCCDLRQNRTLGGMAHKIGDSTMVHTTCVGEMDAFSSTATMTHTLVPPSSVT